MEAGQRSSSVVMGQRLLSHEVVGQRSSHWCLPEQNTGEELQQKVHAEMDRDCGRVKPRWTQ